MTRNDISPCKFFKDPWFPKLIVSRKCNVPGFIHPCHYALYNRYMWCIMTGTFQCRDIGFLGLFVFGTRGLRKYVWGHIVSGRPITPPSEVRWGDGTFQIDVSPYKFSGTPGPLVPQTQCPCIDTSLSFCINLYVYILRNAKWQGCINAGTLCHQGRLIWGQGVQENSYWDTSVRDVSSPHLRYSTVWENVKAAVGRELLFMNTR